MGSTKNLDRRLNEHNEGLVTSTRPYRPWKVVAYEAYNSEADAREREQRLKAHGNASREFKKRAKYSLLENGAGYTLVEMLVTIAIFSLAFIAISSIFIGTTTAQNNARANVAVLNESQLVFEQIAREIRSHTIDTDPTTCNCPDVNFICLKDLSGQTTFIRHNAVNLNAELSHSTSCSGASWSVLNDPSIRIDSLVFYPNDDPTEQPFTSIQMTATNNANVARQRTLLFQTMISTRYYAPRNIQ